MDAHPYGSIDDKLCVTAFEREHFLVARFMNKELPRAMVFGLTLGRLAARGFARA